MGSQNSSQSSESKPYQPLRPAIQTQINAAERMFKNSKPTFYGGSTVAAQNFLEKDFAKNAHQGAMGNMDPVFDNVKSKVLPAVASQFSAAGRSPGSAGSYGGVAADALTNAYAPIAAQQYNADQSRLYQSGQDLRSFYERRMQEDAARHDFNQNSGWDQLAKFQNALQLGGNYGTQSSSTPYNPFMMGLGGLTSLGGGLLGNPGLFG